MRQLATSVTVITTDFGGSSHGMTATAVCSVCADPPTILIVVSRSARTHPIIVESGIFVVNILARNQSALSDRFAGKIVDQFAGIDYTPGIVARFCPAPPPISNAVSSLPMTSARIRSSSARSSTVMQAAPHRYSITTVNMSTW
jgi:flavin reductase (DIM6/NTAB) family NADH-FMN oxidoreductase RutF